MTRVGTPRDRTGERNGWLVAVRIAERRWRPHKTKPEGTFDVMWECRCDCGNTVKVTSGNLTTTKSCGCMPRGLSSTKHGLSHTRAYGIWKMMVMRCREPKLKVYHRYGGRGITVAPEWMDFMGFYSDMGDPPEGLTLDRIDNDGPYSKKNCRWATRKQQANNTSRTVYVETPNGTMPLAVAAEEFGIRLETLLYRAKTNQPMDRLFSRVRIDGRGALRERD